MKANYDFSKSQKNPYAKRLRQQITMRLDNETVEYFKNLAVETGVSYQVLINLYLRDAVTSGKTLHFAWRPKGTSA